MHYPTYYICAAQCCPYIRWKYSWKTCSPHLGTHARVKSGTTKPFVHNPKHYKHYILRCAVLFYLEVEVLCVGRVAVRGGVADAQDLVDLVSAHTLGCVGVPPAVRRVAPGTMAGGPAGCGSTGLRSYVTIIARLLCAEQEAWVDSHHQHSYMSKAGGLRSSSPSPLFALRACSF